MACKSTVRVWYDENSHPVRYKLLCSGKCKDSDTEECKPFLVTIVHRDPQTNRDDWSSTEESCSCSDGEAPAGCAIYLRTEFHYSPPSVTIKMYCSSLHADCPDDKPTCAPRPIREQPVPIQDPDGGYAGKMGKFIDFECQCVPADEL